MAGNKQDKKPICSKETLKHWLTYYYYLFHVLDFTVGVMFCVNAYFIISTSTLTAAKHLSRHIIPIYYFMFGLTIITLIFYVPKIFYAMGMFYWTSFGRFFILLFLSMQLMTFGEKFDVAVGIYIGSVSIIYLIFGCLTIDRFPVLKSKLPPPIFQRNVPPPTQYNEKQKLHLIDSTSGSLKDRMASYESAVKSDEEMKDKLDIIHNNKNIETMDKNRKQQATNVLTKYAETQSLHIQDINKLNKEIKDINKSNAVQKMINLGLMSVIYVKENVFERYGERSIYLNKLTNGNENENKENDTEYIEMYVLNMMNNGLLTKLSETQIYEFEKLLLYSLESVNKLYLIELTRANINSMLLEKIINVLIERSKNENKFGPEEFYIESNNINDNGMKCVINYIAENDKDLKVIKAGHLFNTISSEICKLFGDILNEKNEYLLKLSIDIEYWAQYQTTIDKGLNRNNDMFRKQRNDINGAVKSKHEYKDTVGLPDNLLELTSKLTMPESEAPNTIEITMQIPPKEKFKGTGILIESKEEKEDSIDDIPTDHILNGNMEILEQEQEQEQEHEQEIKDESNDIQIVMNENKEENNMEIDIENNKQGLPQTNIDWIEDDKDNDNDNDNNEEMLLVKEEEKEEIIQGIIDNKQIKQELETDISTNWTDNEQISLQSDVGLYIKVNMMNLNDMTKDDWKAIAVQHNENFWQNNNDFKGRTYKQCKSQYKKGENISVLNGNDDISNGIETEQLEDMNVIDQSTQYQPVVTDDNYV